jgi:hypothetical protein
MEQCFGDHESAVTDASGNGLTDETVRGWAAEINRYHVSVGCDGHKAQEKYAEGHVLFNYWDAWNHAKTGRQKIELIEEYADYVAYGLKLRSVFDYYDNLLDHFKKTLPYIYGQYDSSKIRDFITKFTASEFSEVYGERLDLLEEIKGLLDEPWREILPEETDGTIKQEIQYMMRLHSKHDAFNKCWIDNVLRPLVKSIYAQGRSTTPPLNSSGV